MGEAALLIEGTPPLPLTNRYVLALTRLFDIQPLQGVRSVVPAIASVLIMFDPLQLLPEQLERHAHDLLTRLHPIPVKTARTVSIPVTYGGEAGPDLEDIAQRMGLSPREVVSAHCANTYQVLMIGFAPGFPYIGWLPKQLVLPRRATPRPAVPPGSVAIAADWTGIYPARLPGGWHIIGRTSLCLFDPTATPPTLLEPGNNVQFIAQPEGLTP